MKVMCDLLKQKYALSETALVNPFTMETKFSVWRQMAVRQ